MKKTYFLLALMVITCSVFYYGCDDAGTLPVEIKAGQVVLMQAPNLPTLDPVNDGMYNLWILLTDTLGAPRFSHLGRFNVLSNGNTVDQDGNPVTLAMNPNDTLDLARALYAIISIDVGIVGQPGPTRIVAAPVNVLADSVTSAMRMSDTAALGSSGASISVPNSVFYIVNSPTGSNCAKGVWFCDQDGAVSWPSGNALKPGWGWQYRGWVRNKITNEYFTTGTFYRADTIDSDWAGSCADTLGTGYNVPGQDWDITGCTNFASMLDGNHEVFVTLEPEGRPANIAPFVLKLYYQNLIVTSVGCNRRDNMFTQRQNLPSINLRVTR